MLSVQGQAISTFPSKINEKATHVLLSLPADQAGLAVIARPSLLVEVVDQVPRVDPARGVDGGAAAEARDQRLGLASGVACVRAQALAADGHGVGALENEEKQGLEYLEVEHLIS